MRRETLALLALLALMAFAFQGTRGIWEPDEGRYTATGLNMLETGDWLVPTLDREHAHLTKPPLTYWAIAASIGAFGHNEWAARLPGALAFLGTGLLVLGLGRRLCPRRPALPAIAWGLSLVPVAAANVVSTDILLVLFETAAVFAFVEAWRTEGSTRRRWVLAMWAAWGLAFMTKGPPGLLPLGAMVAFLAIHDRPRLKGLFAPAGLLLFAVVAFTWFGVLVWQEPDRLGYFLGYEVYDRIFTDAHHRNARWYGAFEVYLPVLLFGALPWTALAVAAAGGPRGAWRRIRGRVRERDRETLLLLYWILLPLAVFFLARSRLELYVLPLFVPIALVSARALADWPWLDRRHLAWTIGLTGAALLALKGTLAWWPSDRDSRAMAADIRSVIETHGVEELAFVGMRPFYGLTLYLDVAVEGVHFEGPAPQYSRFLSEDTLCAELGERERNLFVVKRVRTGQFLARMTKCGDFSARDVGSFEADGNELVLFTVRPAPAGAPPG